VNSGEDRTHLLSMLKFIMHQGADYKPALNIFIQQSSTEA